jgi:hypothetical protein
MSKTLSISKVFGTVVGTANTGDLDTDFNAIRDFVNDPQSKVAFADDTGTANAVAFTLSPAVITLAQYLTILFKAAATNTGATTINVSPTPGTAKAVKKVTPAGIIDLTAGDIVVGGIYEVSYQLAADVFILHNPSPAPFLGSRAFVDRLYTTQTVVNTTTETTIYTLSVPGGTLGTNKRLRITMVGDILNNTGGVQQENIRVKYGATTIATMGSLGLGFSAIRRPIWAWVELVARNSTSSQFAHYYYKDGTAPGAGGISGTTADGTEDTNGQHQTVAEDSTVTKNLVITFQPAAASPNFDIRSHLIDVELIN